MELIEGNNMNELWQALIIGAFTLAGPFIGIQAQKFFERKQIIKQRKGEIFRTLLTSQKDKSSTECVKALNLLLVDFPDANQAFKNAVSDYKEHINNGVQHGTDAQRAKWDSELNNKFDKLLSEVAENYDKSLIKDKQLETFNYLPQIQADRKHQEQVIRNELSEILSGKKPLNIAVTDFPAEKT
jgi:hypothetical protein